MFMNVFFHSLMITGFVFTMMLVIEYINVQTQGTWHQSLSKNKWLQYLIAAALGATPGCLGAFTAVTLFSHKVISFGALVTAMIATSGDESFLMLAMFPGKALLLTGVIFVIGIFSGFFTDRFIPTQFIEDKIRENRLPLHNDDKCICYPKGQIIQQLKNPSMERVLLIVILALFMISIISGKIGPEKWNWIRVTLAFTSLLSFFIVSTVPQHFLKEHLWDHIIKVHIPKIFLWTFGALLATDILMQYVDLNTLITENMILTLIIAVLVGIIPESGPHMLFVTMYAQGILPFNILLASSIVQDGHGMLPVLAESKRGFLLVKAINVIVGLAVGLLFLGLGH